jgi:TonB family protein
MVTLHQWLADWSSWGWPLLANHLWQATLLSTAAFAAAALLKRAPGRARYAIWLIASAKFVVPSALLVFIAGRFGFEFSSLLTSVPESGQGYTVIYQLTSPVTQPGESAIAGAAAARAHNELFCVLTVAWFTGCVFMLMLWWRRRRQFRLAMRARPVANATRERLALSRVRSWLGIRRNVDLSVLPGTIEPGVWGVWRPTVVLPESIAANLSEAELEAVMMHEMIHVARWDNLIANLHRILCCLLWFHPIVWILDRLLLAEREQACDEEVIRLGGASDVYASSLLKVLRFCLGWSVAGASNAAGSNLGRRVERIMSSNVQAKLSMWQRAAIGSVAVLVVVLSLAAGLLTHAGVSAQGKKPSEGVIRGVPGGVPGGVAGGVPGGIPGGVSDEITALAFGGGQKNLIERIDTAPEMAVEFKNSAKSPLTITDARAKAVLRVPDEPGDDYAVLPLITVTNNTDRRIKGVAFEFRNGLDRRGYYELIPSLIQPRGIYTSGAQRRLFFLTGGTSGWTVRVAGVIFEDGDVWGAVPPPPPPPPPPPSAELRLFDQVPETAIGFKNSEGAPLSITSATVKAFRIDPSLQPGSDSNSEDRYLIKTMVQLVNNTSRRITGVGIEYPSAESKDWMRTFATVKIDPYGSYRLGSPSPEASALFLRGNPDRMEARVMGVQFEDGEVWGSFPSPSPPPPPPPPPQMTPALDAPQLIRKSGGVMMTSATHRVEPEYPPLARAARISGLVVVEVTVDEAGLVTSARAISGHPLLKDAAVNAARQWQFSPTALSGVPVKVVGTLTFNFEP